MAKYTFFISTLNPQAFPKQGNTWRWPFSCQRGFTFVEVLFALAIGTILLGLSQPALVGFHQLLVQQEWGSSKQMELEKFKMLLKGEILQAGYGLSSPPIQVTSDSVQLLADWNLDGDSWDTRETIVYRFDQPTQTLLRKSGKGSFQSLIQDIYQVRFESVLKKDTAEGTSFCIKIQSQLESKSLPQEATLCPLFH